ncbi:MAG: hypothetical protein QM756_25080 [Polyangiaceae bacterium]
MASSSPTASSSAATDGDSGTPCASTRAELDSSWRSSGVSRRITSPARKPAFSARDTNTSRSMSASEYTRTWEPLRAGLGKP